MISTGTVPALSLQDATTGEPVALGDLSGRQGLVLYLMRSATCAICNRHVDALRAAADRFAGRGVSVAIAVPEGVEAAAEWKTRRGINLPVVTGMAGSPHEAFGLNKKVFGMVQQAGVALISADGEIAYAHGATNPVNSLDMTGLEEAIMALA